MRCVDEPGRSLKVLRLAVLATISVAAVSCSSDTHRFQYNPFRSQTQASSTDVPGSPASRAASNAPHTPAPTIGAPATSSSQHVHVVSPGETLMALSRKYHKPLGAIAKANNIEPHTMVKVGDRIVIPGVAPQAAAKPPALTQAPKSPSASKVASVPAAPSAAMVTPATHEPEPPKAKADVT